MKLNLNGIQLHTETETETCTCTVYNVITPRMQECENSENSLYCPLPFLILPWTESYIALRKNTGDIHYKTQMNMS